MNCHSENILKRYLEAVAVWLPAPQRDDIAAEIAEDLRSKIDERELTLGRALDEEELVEILKQRGHPLAIAARYTPQQYLIGPALFPIYRFIVKAIVLWIQLPLFALIIGPLDAFSSGHPIDAILRTAGHYVFAAIMAFAVNTLVFAALERHPAKATQNWDPRRLPTFAIQKAILDTDPKRWARGVSQFAFSLVFALGWRHLVQHSSGIIAPKLYAVLQATYWPVMISLLAGVGQGIATLFFPARTPLRAGFRLANAALSLVVVVILFKLQAVEQIAASFLPPSALTGPDARWMHIGLQLPLLIIAAAIIADAAKELWQLKRTRTRLNWALKPAAGK